MKNYKQVENKLEGFIRKFYYNELIKGGIFFLSFGLIYFLLIVFLEYFFWLTSLGRTILFWAFIAVEVGLLFKFVLHPLLKLFKLSKGLNYHKASQMIGEHFPKVSDKLTNILQLKDAGEDSDLIIAGIEQKAEEIQPIPFELAIDFKTNISYTKYLILPVLVFILIWASGLFTNFTDSYKRVVDYKTAYEPPAPFSFLINENQLEVEAGKNLYLQVLTEGETTPENVHIEIEGESYLLKKVSANQFEYRFQNLQSNTNFRLVSNQVKSRPYSISIIDVPRISNFEMQLNYPAYTGISNEILSGSGNASIPEGTQVTWNIKTSHTNQLQFQLKDSIISVEASEDQLFTLQKDIVNSTSYQVSTSNDFRKNYEELNYQLQVVKDEFPKIKLTAKQDSINNEITYFQGKLSDDYGLQSAHLVYFPTEDENQKERVSLPISKSTYAEFLYTFPNQNLNLKPGTSYTYYFQVADNDGVNGSKISTSKRFNFRKKTAKEERDQNLDKQSESLKGMQESMDKLKEDKDEFQEIEQLQKEKSKMSFSDKKKLDNFLKRQQQQRDQMKRFSKELKENLKDFKPEQDNQRKQDLMERLEENEQRLEENADLLKELEDLKDKIDEDGFKEKLDEFSNDKEKQERTLEQLLELTKRFYVENKAEQLTEKLQDLAEEQDKLADDEENNNAENQSKINEAFDQLKEDLEELQKQNEDLVKPLDLFRDEDGEDEISEDLQDILSELSSDSDTDEDDSNTSDDDSSDVQDSGDSSQEGSEGDSDDSDDSSGEESDSGDEDSPASPSASPQEKQKSTSQKMKEMSEKMGMSMMMGGEEQDSEDIEMLRQILDNLVTFSFQQEDLMNEFKNSSNNNPAFANKLRQQAELRENFKHIDDSLYALALRNEMISEQVTTKLSDISFNIDKSLERLADNQVRLANSNQQFTMTYANDLAIMLDSALDNMQDQLSGGSGSGNSGEGSEGEEPGEQLSDIIKSHDELKELMQEQMGDQEGEENGQDGEDGEPSEGEDDAGGEGGSDGEQNSSEGQDGEDGESIGEEEGDESEMSSGQLYEIYKKQQDLKNQLEDRIKQLGLDNDSRNLNKSLEKLEQELLMKGLSSEALKQMEEVKHQLLKLQEATQKQGQDEQRQAETNEKDFDVPNAQDLDRAKDYFNTTELLNRQQLPLQTKYKNLIKLYFDERED